MNIRPFERPDIAAAAGVLAERHSAMRAAMPLLPPETVDSCAAAVGRALDDGARGVAAFDGEYLCGFLLATPGDNGRGSHVWTDLWGHGYKGDPETMRVLYGRLADGWTADSRGHHYLVAPRLPVRDASWRTRGIGGDEADIWHSLGFGHEQVHAVMGTGVPERASAGVRVRRAGPEHLRVLAPLFPMTAEAHRVAPTFAFIEQEFYDELEEGHLELLSDPGVGYWMAEDDGAILGFAVLRPVPDEEVTMVHPAGSIELLAAATTPAARGRGIMGAVLSRALGWAKGEGYEVCVTDWRAANLDSSTAWPRLGFRPMCYRLHRIIDPRMLP
jgi:GNAT superfamily N-acetyltransferase